MKTRRTFVYLGVTACFTGCIGDFVMTFVFGRLYPGYSQLHDTMSSLGTSDSPVSEVISLWWVLLGILMLLFALSFSRAFPPGKYSKIATGIIALYGLGEGFGSGLFKADRIGDILTRSAWIHDALGGLGVAGLVVLPLVMQRILPRSENARFCLFSKVVFGAGIFFLLLFLARYSDIGMLKSYKGLWQRLFVLDYYLYLMSIAAIMTGISRRKETSA